MLFHGDLKEWQSDAVKIPFGLTLRCISGQARVYIDLTQIELGSGMLLTVFPEETVQIQGATADFLTSGLAYSETFLREVSLQVEHTVYRNVRTVRYRSEDNILTGIFSQVEALLRSYQSDISGVFWRDIAQMQLRTFFMAYHDYLSQHPIEARLQGSRRMHDLFSRFMQILEQQYKLQHDVAFYAEQLHITPKYLCVITRTITHRTPKDLIDHQLVIQIKLRLRTSPVPIKQIVDEFGFSSFSFFTRYFHQQTGMTPQEYRRVKN